MNLLFRHGMLRVTVTAGSLDALVGLSGSVSQLYGVGVQSFNASGSTTDASLASATIATTGGPAPATTATGTERFTIASVDDAANSFTLVLSDGGQVLGRITQYVLGYARGSILYGTSNSSTTVGLLRSGASVDDMLGVFSPDALAAGTAIAYSAGGSYFDPASLVQNTVTVVGAATVPAAIAGSFNTEIFSPTANGQTFQVTAGYQVASVSGGSPVQLVDRSGGVFVAAGPGNSTLLSAASGTDTLQTGAGDNVLVAFAGGTFMSALGYSGNNLFYSGATPVTVLGGNGHDTAVMSAGGLITTGNGGSQVWLTTGSTVIYSNGADTIVAGSGPETVDALGNAGDLVFAGSGTTVLNSGSGATTLVGLQASVTVQGGTGGGTFFGGTAGHNLMNSGTGTTIMVGGGDGDLLVATGSANDELVARTGAETLNAAGSTGTNAFFGGFGDDVMIGGTGANTFTSGPGNMTLVGGGSLDLFVFQAGAASKAVVQGFNAGHDFIQLAGFGPGEARAALAGATATSGGTSLNLSDGTQITFAGLARSSLSGNNFI